MTEQEMMEIWTRVATPGPEHAAIGRMAGQWKAVVKSWMDPSKPPTEAEGSATFSMLLGGRVRHEDFHCAMMGMQFDGIGMLGFDNHTRKYWMTWADNMSTATMFMEGSAAPDGKTITLAGRVNKPAEKRDNVPMTCSYKLIHDDHHVFECFEQLPDGKEFRTLEIHYTRN